MQTTTVLHTTGADENVHVPSLILDMLHTPQEEIAPEITRFIYRTTTLNRLPIGASYMLLHDQTVLHTRTGEELEDPFVISTTPPSPPELHQCTSCLAIQTDSKSCTLCDSPTIQLTTP